jgi:hypothetical protein
MSRLSNLNNHFTSKASDNDDGFVISVEDESMANTSSKKNEQQIQKAVFKNFHK